MALYAPAQALHAAYARASAHVASQQNVQRLWHLSVHQYERSHTFVNSKHVAKWLCPLSQIAPFLNSTVADSDIGSNLGSNNNNTAS